MSLRSRRGGVGTIFLVNKRERCRAPVCHDLEGMVVKDIIDRVCASLDPPIYPVARTFFALCDAKTGICLSPYHCLTAADARKQYQLRVFVNTTQNAYHFLRINKTAYTYYYEQLREDFIQGDISPPLPVSTGTWMAAIDMAREASMSKKTFDELLGDLSRFMPEHFRVKHKTDSGMQYMLRNTFSKFIGFRGPGGEGPNPEATTAHYRSKYIEVYEKDEMCGTHIFRLEPRRREQVYMLFVSSKRGIFKRKRSLRNSDSDPQPQEDVCTIEQIEQLMVNFDALSVTINKLVEGVTSSTFLHFAMKTELVAFCVIVDTYYRLMVDGNRTVLGGDLLPPESSTRVGPNDGLMAELCHAPISPSSVQHVLKKFDLKDGYFMVKESRSKLGSFTLSLCYNGGIMNYRIVRLEDSMLTFVNPDSSVMPEEVVVRFPSLHALIEGHKHMKNGLPTYLTTNCNPNITGPIPLLMLHRVLPESRSDSSFSDKENGTASPTGTEPPDSAIVQELIKDGVKWINYKELQINNELGSGNFSTVYQAIWKTADQEVVVAVKIPTMNSSTVATVIDDLQREIRTMAHLDHPNVVKLLGITLTSHFLSFIGHIPMVVMEFIDGGSLKHTMDTIRVKYVELVRGPNSSRGTKFWGEQVPILLEFCKQIAVGMQYLEDQKVVHRDLATRNVLVVSQNHVKISDFGLARQRKDEQYYRCSKPSDLPIYWYAPESLNELKFTHKSDVWSYGVTVWEVFSLGETPKQYLQKFIDGAKTVQEACRKLGLQLSGSQRLPKPGKCQSSELNRILQECWSVDPTQRPTFTDLVERVALVNPW